MDAGLHVVAVHRSAKHAFSKNTQDWITLLEGLGVEDDAHCGRTVQNVYQMRKDRQRPNLRQVHLLQTELLDDLRQQGFEVQPGDLGENISTRGLDMLSLPKGARLRIGNGAIVEVTGLRRPCVQVERFRKGLNAQLARRRPGGDQFLKVGVMGIVVQGGKIRGNDRIVLQMPVGLHVPLGPV